MFNFTTGHFSITMAEILGDKGKIPEGLLSFGRAAAAGEDLKEVIKTHRSLIDSATPFQTMVMLDTLLHEGFSVTEVKSAVGKILNMLHKSLASFEWDKPAGDHFLRYMMQENREAEKRIVALRALVKEFFNGPAGSRGSIRPLLLNAVTELEPYELHYIKKENILFPVIEQTFPSYGCLKVMWAFHDDFRDSLRTLKTMLSSPDPAADTLNRELGRLFFTVLPVIFREEQIVFPVAVKAIPEETWHEMLVQGHETGWCYITPPAMTGNDTLRAAMPEGLTDLLTGSLTAYQIALMLDNLPVDITFVDENDTVRYFSGTKHRIFPRSKAIIGRKVQNCHPHDSVSVVEEILGSFRERRNDHADFWIRIKGRLIYIRYFALYDGNGKYCGTIEVSQDVTEIKGLEGEKRLLDLD